MTDDKSTYCCCYNPLFLLYCSNRHAICIHVLTVMRLGVVLKMVLNCSFSGIGFIDDTDIDHDYIPD